MRRPAFALAALLAATSFGVALAGCGGEENTSATPQTVVGTVATTTPAQPTLPASKLKGDPVAGKAIFTTNPPGCFNCHTLKDAKATANVGPNLDQVKPSDALVIQFVTNGKGGMPSFKSVLTAQQIANVAAYVSSVAGK